MTSCHAGEAVKLGSVAVKRRNQRAVDDRAGIRCLPKCDPARAKRADQRFRSFLFAARREQLRLAHEGYDRLTATGRYRVADMVREPAANAPPRVAKG